MSSQAQGLVRILLHKTSESRENTMNFFNSMKLRTKLLLAFIAMSLVAMTVGIVGYASADSRPLIAGRVGLTPTDCGPVCICLIVVSTPDD